MASSSKGSVWNVFSHGRLICALLAFVFFSAPGWTSLAADDPDSDSDPAIQAEEDAPPPPAATPKKRVRHRANPAPGSRNDRVEMGTDVVIRAGEVVRELVVIAGNATVDGTVEGNLVVVSGSAKVNGRVKKDLVTILGSATLGPQARIAHDTVVVGGRLTADPQATVGGQQTVVTLGQVLPDFDWLQHWLNKGLFLARPFPPQIKWVWVVAGLFLLLYLALSVVFPRPVRACAETLAEQPVASFFIGILLFVLIGPLLFLLVVSVAGLLAIPFVLCALIAAALLGKTAVYSYAGQQVGRQMHVPELSLPMVLIIGAALFYVIYMVPVLGFAVWAVVTLIGLGAVLLAGFGSFRREPAPVYYPGVAAGTSSEMPPGIVAGEASPPSLTVGGTAGDMALLPRVGFWRRCCATLLDFLLLCLLIHVTGPLFLLVWAAYHILMWTWKGTTIGGIVMSMKIVRVDGQPIDFAVALVRCLSSFFSAFALFLGFFWAGWDRERQAWHDKIAGTIVVKVPKGMSLI